MNAPVCGRFAFPLWTVKLLIGLAIGCQRVEVWACGIGKPDDGRKAGGVASRILRAAGVLGMWTGEVEPGDVVEQLIHRLVHVNTSVVNRLVDD